MTTTLATICYTIKDGKIVEGTLADFSCFIESTTRPTGVGYKYYATTISRRCESTTDDDGNEVLPAEEFEDIWVLAKWATWGGPERVIREHASESDALADAEQTYVHDILDNPEISIWLDRADAERFLAENE